MSIFDNKKRDERIAKEYWRMENIWKPLFQLFLAVCVLYTVMHVLKIEAPRGGEYVDPYELTR